MEPLDGASSADIGATSEVSESFSSSKHGVHISDDSDSSLRPSSEEPADDQTPLKEVQEPTEGRDGEDCQSLPMAVAASAWHMLSTPIGMKQSIPP